MSDALLVLGAPTTGRENKVARLPTADELFAEASAILALRAQLGVDAEPCLAADYRDACVRYVNFDDHHRPGPRQQAQLLLQQLGECA